MNLKDLLKYGKELKFNDCGHKRIPVEVHFNNVLIGWTNRASMKAYKKKQLEYND